MHRQMGVSGSHSCDGVGRSLGIVDHHPPESEGQKEVIRVQKLVLTKRTVGWRIPEW